MGKSEHKITPKSYEEAIHELGSFIGKELWHDYMGGSMMPRCEDRGGIIKTLSIIYTKDKETVTTDIEKESIKQYKSLSKS